LTPEGLGFDADAMTNLHKVTCNQSWSARFDQPLSGRECFTPNQP
jgi:hypothetical protein